MRTDMKHIHRMFVAETGKEPQFGVTADMIEAGCKAIQSLRSIDDPETDELCFRVYEAMEAARAAKLSV